MLSDVVTPEMETTVVVWQAPGDIAVVPFVSAKVPLPTVLVRVTLAGITVPFKVLVLFDVKVVNEPIPGLPVPMEGGEANYVARSRAAGAIALPDGCQAMAKVCPEVVGLETNVVVLAALW